MTVSARHRIKQRSLREEGGRRAAGEPWRRMALRHRVTVLSCHPSHGKQCPHAVPPCRSAVEGQVTVGSYAASECQNALSSHTW